MIIWIHVSIAFIHTDCQFLSTCNTSCSWNSCCEINCTDYCNQAFSCQIDNETITAGNFSWCTVEVNDSLTPSLINITFASNSDCTICNHEDDTCCGFEDDDTVIPINCSTVSTYSPLTPSSSQSSDVYSGIAYYISLFATSIVSSVLIKTQLTHTQHFTTSVPYTSNKAIPVAPAVIGGIVMPLLVVLTSVITISCILVVIHKKHSKSKQMKAQKQNWWVNNYYMYVYTRLLYCFCWIGTWMLMWQSVKLMAN